MAILFVLADFNHEKWVRNQEEQFILEGLIDPFDGFENIQRKLTHDDPKDPEPLSPEDQDEYDAFMAEQKRRWRYDEDLGPLVTRPYAGGN